MPFKPTIPRVCLTCGSDFLAYPQQIKNGYGKYCNHRCYGLSYANSLADRLYKDVDTSDPDACWIRPYSQHRKTSHSSIGTFNKSRPAQVVAWEIYNQRPMRPGYQGAHLCNNPPCVNPRHIAEQTPAENARYMVECGRAPRHRRKVTDDQVREIRTRHASGERICDLAREFGLGWNTVYEMVRRITWPDVE